MKILFWLFKGLSRLYFVYNFMYWEVQLQLWSQNHSIPGGFFFFFFFFSLHLLFDHIQAFKSYTKAGESRMRTPSHLVNITKSSQPLIKYQLTIINYNSGSSTILGSGDVVVNDIDKAPAFDEFMFY